MSELPAPRRRPSCAAPGRLHRSVEEPKKKSVIGTIFIALILIGVIAYGVQKLRPVIEDARKINAAQKRADKDAATALRLPDAATNAAPAVPAGNETAGCGEPRRSASGKEAGGGTRREAGAEEDRTGCERAGSGIQGTD